MGDFRDQFVDLDATADTAEQRAHEVRTFLRDRGFAEPDERAGDDRWRDAIVDRAGPAWQAPWLDYYNGPGSSWWKTIAVLSPTEVNDQAFFAMDSTGPPECRTCGEMFDEDTF